MTLRRQLLLVSLLTLVLPWAGCQLIQETESALREGQQRMLAGAAQAIAESLAQFPQEFIVDGEAARWRSDQLYSHALQSAPVIDGYFDDWPLPPESLVTLDSKEAQIRFVVGTYRQYVYLFLDVIDASVVYADLSAGSGDQHANMVALASVNLQGDPSIYRFAPEAPGTLTAYRRLADSWEAESRILADWQDTPHGYRLEARIPRQLAGARLGIVITNSDGTHIAESRVATFNGAVPGRLVSPSALLQTVIAGYTQPGLRLMVTDAAGWRLAAAGATSSMAGPGSADKQPSGWMRIVYDLLLESGDEASLVDRDPLGREQQPYVRQALGGKPATSWFRSQRSGQAVVAVAQPIWSGNVQTGAVILQQGTDAILSLTNRALARLINVTVIATFVVAIALLGYATWLSLRIRRLSAATLGALDGAGVQAVLPSANAADEIGDLSRSFSSVLRQLGEYNEYLRTLASKLSHEMRTPLAIVTSSLENLEHEVHSQASTEYTARAKSGARRLQKILNAMSEANRVEELMKNAEPETFDLAAAMTSTVAAYADAWPARRFAFQSDTAQAHFHGSPELIIQMLDKLVDNAVEFSGQNDQVSIRLSRSAGWLLIEVSNPGPQLPERMRSQLFDSMISVRDSGFGQHLGLGLYIARLIVTGHGGTISASNIDDGVRFEVRLPDVSGIHA